MKRFTYKDWLLACFLLGILGGTGAALFFGTTQTGGGAQALKGGREFFFQVLRLRLFQLGAGWIAGLTICSVGLFGVICVYAGMSLSASLVVFTLEKGLWGLAAFGAAMIPQGICYLAVWAALAMWAGIPEKKLHLLSLGLLAVMTGIGAFLEAFAAPAIYGLWF